MKSSRTIVNILFIILGGIGVYFLSYHGKDNYMYYVATYIVILSLLGRVRIFPLTEHHMIPFLGTSLNFLILFLVFAKFDIEYSTITFLLEAAFIAAWLSSWSYVKNKFSAVILGYFETENTRHLIDTKKFHFVAIDINSKKDYKLDGIIFDEIVEHNEETRLYIAEKGINDLPVIRLSNILEKTSGKIAMHYIASASFDDFSIAPFYSVFKRIIDFVITIVFSPAILLLMLFTVLGVKLSSKGPAFFIQERTGKGDKPFKMYKFRSMIVESEKDGAKFATKGDSRITPFGKFIRKYRLDELPQFFNILKGDMSLIGPRPEQKVFTDKFNHEIPFYPYRHAVRPGITGWAQVSQGYAATVEQTEQKVEYDLYYIKNFSIWLDMLVVTKTIRTILTGFGSR